MCFSFFSFLFCEENPLSILFGIIQLNLKPHKRSSLTNCDLLLKRVFEYSGILDIEFSEKEICSQTKIPRGVAKQNRRT